jgi:phosphonate transport system substrate-binding protein
MATNPQPTNPTPPAAKFSPGRVFKILIPAIAGVGLIFAWFYYKEQRNIGEVNYRKEIGSSMSRVYAEFLKLDPALTDADGDMVADTPTDPAKHLDPPTLVFAPLPTAEGPASTWDDFKAHLAKQTGKAVEYRDVVEIGELRQLIKDGSVHVVGVNTGAVPVAVNVGFVPVCVPAAADGTFGYEMEILVPADSPVKSPKDLKGKTLKLTGASSHSGYKAALVILNDEFKLEPGRDFAFPVTGGHDKSIQLLARKECDAVAVAGDLLHRAVAHGDIKAEQYRSIYKSAKFPPAAYGYGCKLKPELAAKVREAFVTFDWKGTGLEKSYAGTGQVKFVPVDYKKDWQYVRDIDAKLMQWAK